MYLNHKKYLDTLTDKELKRYYWHQLFITLVFTGLCAVVFLSFHDPNWSKHRTEQIFFLCCAAFFFGVVFRELNMVKQYINAFGKNVLTKGKQQ